MLYEKVRVLKTSVHSTLSRAGRCLICNGWTVPHVQLNVATQAYRNVQHFRATTTTGFTRYLTCTVALLVLRLKVTSGTLLPPLRSRNALRSSVCLLFLFQIRSRALRLRGMDGFTVGARK